MVKLDIHQPLIAHLPQSAYLLSIIGDKPDEYDWVMNNFINIMFNSKLGNEDFYRSDCWYNCYHITENAMTKSYIDGISNGNIVDFIINSINNGYYVYTYAITKYLPHQKNDSDIRHAPLFYGYDSTTKRFYIADSFCGNRFLLTDISYTQARSALSYDEFNNPKYYPYILFRLIKKKEGYTYNFDYHDMYLKILDYMDSKCYFNNLYPPFDCNIYEDFLWEDIENPYDYSFGLNFYYAAIESALDKKLRSRQLHLLYCHKAMMKARLVYLGKKYKLDSLDELMENCDDILRNTTIVRNRYYKDELKHVFDVNRIVSELYLLKKQDTAFTSKLLLALERTKIDV